MGLTPGDFYEMETADFLLSSEGFRQKMDYEQSLLKRVAYITHASMVQKPLHPDKLWPIGEVKKIDKEYLKKRSSAIMDKLALMQKIDEEKKNGRAVKNRN